jgi:hypothetical protein
MPTTKNEKQIEKTEIVAWHSSGGTHCYPGVEAMGAVVEFGMSGTVAEHEPAIGKLFVGERSVVGRGREGRSEEVRLLRGRLVGYFTRRCVLVQDDKLLCSVYC